MIEQLKPCPFCGGKADVYKDEFNKFFVECSGCNTAVGVHLGAGWSAVFNRRSYAEGAWNHRAEPKGNKPPCYQPSNDVPHGSKSDGPGKPRKLRQDERCFGRSD